MKAGMAGRLVSESRDAWEGLEARALGWRVLGSMGRLGAWLAYSVKLRKAERLVGGPGPKHEVRKVWTRLDGSV